MTWKAIRWIEPVCEDIERHDTRVLAPTSKAYYVGIRRTTGVPVRCKLGIGEFSQAVWPWGNSTNYATELFALIDEGATKQVEKDLGGLT